MNKEKNKILKRDRRRAKIRAKISGTKETPRFSIFKSNREMFVQLINDEAGKTLVSAHSSEIKLDKKSADDNVGRKTQVAFALGKLIAKKAADQNIKDVVFDRGGYRYHGRVKAVAEGARENGLIF